MAVAQIAATRLEGVIENASGAPVKGAKVIATQIETGFKAQVQSDSEGRFVFPALLPGGYSVLVEARGFRPLSHSNILLGLSSAFEEKFVVQIGGANDAMEEETLNERLNKMESGISGAIGRRELDVLPQLNRNPLSLAILQPGAQINTGTPDASRFNGNQQGSNDTSLDGIGVNDPVDPRLGASQIPLNTDTLEQFRIVTSTAPAEFGRNSGVQIVLNSRSGGTRWFGNAYELFRNKNLAANDFFNNSANIEKPRITQHLYGISLGGPLVKDRTSVFGNYQRRRASQEISRNRLVLTTSAKSGLFQWIQPGTSTTNSFNIVNNDPRRLGIDPKIASVLSQLPEPNNTDIGDGLNTSGFRFNNPNDGLEDQATFRIDHALKTNHRLIARVSWDRGHAVDSINGADATFPGQPAGTNKRRGLSLLGGSEWMLSPRTVNQLRVGYQSAKISLDHPGRIAGPMLLANSWTNLQDPSFSRWRNSPVIEVNDNLSQIRGRHSLKAGFTFRYTTQKGGNDAGIYPDVTFGRGYGNLPPSNIGPARNLISLTDRQTFEYLYNDLLGRIDQVTQTFNGNLQTFFPAGTGRTRDFIFKDYAVFMQDDWKLRDNLTVNLGVRYELNGVPSEKDGIQGALDKASEVSSSANIANFSMLTGSALYNQDYLSIAPRAGFAWSPRNNTKMVLRGGYGIFFDRLPGTTANFIDNNTPPSSLVVSIFPNSGGTDRRLSDGIPVPAAGSPVLTLPSSRSTSVAIFTPDLRTPYVHHFSLLLERQMFKNTIVEAGYVGQRGKKLFANLNLNQPKINGGFLLAFKELQNLRFFGTPVPSTNPLVAAFGSPNAAISAIGGTILDQGLVAVAADIVDRNHFGKYAAAGISDFYLRNFPQYNQFNTGTNDGFSSYDALQVAARRTSGGLKVSGSYTYSKSLDNVYSNGNTFTVPPDSFSPASFKALSDSDRRHTANAWVVYSLPIGKSQIFAADAPGWASSIISNWEMGMITTWESGSHFTVNSGRQTASPGVDSMANLTTGANMIGEVQRKTDGVYWFNSTQIQAFTFPAAGDLGNSGRNPFTGPGYLNFDMSLVKSIPVRGERRISIRGEVYNMLNRAHFGIPETNLSSATFGKFTSTTGNPRIIQVGVRFAF